jgi:hypothetical protein
MTFFCDNEIHERNKTLFLSKAEQQIRYLLNINISQ